MPTICSFELCGKPVQAHGLCSGHYGQFRRGQPLRTRRGPVALPDRFWSHVDRSGSCWLWLASKDGNGYGHFGLRRHTTSAHRFSWEIANGPIPAGLHVLHRCDNPVCVRPDHLFLGTRGDNMRDMVVKGRSARGEKSGKAKLTDADAIAVRFAHLISGCRQRVLAKAMNVSEQSVSQIVQRKSYDRLLARIDGKDLP